MYEFSTFSEKQKRRLLQKGNLSKKAQVPHLSIHDHISLTSPCYSAHTALVY